MKKNIELLLAKHFAELAQLTLGEVMKDDSISDQEEKAKAYDKAIRKLRGMMPNLECLSYNGKTFLQDIINIFPELAESEDEKIRKGLIEDYKKFNPMDEYLDGVPFSHVVSWLEKQGDINIKGDNYG